MIFIKIFYSILFISLWVLLLKYRRTVKSWTGNFYWAEKYIGNWWTYFVLVLAGLWFIFYGAIYPFWWIEWLFK